MPNSLSMIPRVFMEERKMVLVSDALQPLCACSTSSTP